VYTLIHSLALRQLILEQVPALTVSLIIAEQFYKFGSFTSECLSFLATWYVLDVSLHVLRSRGARARRP
jgi:hypothetical protein